ncbi:MAG: hypothetical protein ACHBN1_23180 [Heteroscytonema crispum UTEX LB 1556]
MTKPPLDCCGNSRHRFGKISWGGDCDRADWQFKLMYFIAQDWQNHSVVTVVNATTVNNKHRFILRS